MARKHSTVDRPAPLLPEATAPQTEVAGDGDSLAVIDAPAPKQSPAAPAANDDAGSVIERSDVAPLRSWLPLSLPIGERRGHAVRNIDLTLTPAEAAALAELAAGLNESNELIGHHKPVTSAADAVRWIAQELIRAKAARAV